MYNKKGSLGVRSLLVRPILLLMTISSILVFLLFNMMVVYLQDQSVIRGLEKMNAEMEQVQKAETIEDIVLGYENLRKELLEVKLLVMNENQTLGYLSKDMEEDHMTSIVKIAEEKGFGKASVKSVRMKENKYYVAKVGIETGGSQAYLIRSGGRFRQVMGFADQALMITLIGMNAVLIIVIYAISNHISIPIKQLSKQADAIGNGTLMPVHVDTSCTELKMLENSLNIVVKRLRSFGVAQNITLQTISQELRVPLLTIETYAEDIKSGSVENQSKGIEVIIEESQRLLLIVDQISMLSRLDTVNQPVHMIPIDLKVFINEQIKEMERHGPKRAIGIVQDRLEEKIIVEADYQLLCHVVMNIFSNAMRYAETSISIEAYQKEGDAILTIADDGAGLTKENLEYLFTRFYKGKAGNFGLGMFAAKAAIEYIGGSISAENGENGGAKFIVKLPIFYSTDESSKEA